MSPPDDHWKQDARDQPQQTGTYYCSGCGRKFVYDHDGHPHCQTQGCPHKSSQSLRDDYY